MWSSSVLLLSSLTSPSFFFSNYTAPTEIYTLSLHDALPISVICPMWTCAAWWPAPRCSRCRPGTRDSVCPCWRRSEEHTSELQSQSNLVCRLLLEKKKIKQKHRSQSQETADAARHQRRTSKP